MKSFFLFICFMFCNSFGIVYGQLPISEPEVWTNLYHGNWSLAHKMVLCRQCNNTNDQILSCFMMSYVHYRAGNIDDALEIFETIDKYIEFTYLN